MITPRQLVLPKLDECRDPYARKFAGDAAKLVVVHRTISDPPDAVGVCKRFQSFTKTDEFEGLGAVTGGENPYHFLIQPDAQIIQAVALTERGAHARRWNSSALAVALMHPCDKSPLPHAMGLALTWLLPILCLYVGGVEGHLYGHDELPGASSDPTKVCPGISMVSLRDIVGDRMADYKGATEAEIPGILAAAGIVISEGGSHGV